MSETLIQWPRAKYWTAQWNPVIGCKPCSPACENCYAAAWARRFGQSFKPHATKQRPPRKGVVFCGNMTDLFGEWVKRPSDYLMEPHYTIESVTAEYLWLTKRVDGMCHALSQLAPPTAWDDGMWKGTHNFGFTAENQEWYDRRAAEARNFPSWANLWLSAEPLLGPVAIGSLVNNLRWVVVGCESGPNRRPCKIEWVESIVEQCRKAGVPVFVKQLDIGGKCETDINKFPEHLRIRQVPWAKEGGAK